MVRQEVLVTVLRFYTQENPKERDSYVAVCTLLWESPSIVWLKGLHGNLTRKVLRDLVQWLLDNKISLVKAIRASGSLPLATYTRGEYCEIDVEKRREEFNKLLRG